MKKKIRIFSCFILISLSLTSCVAKETKIDTNTGNRLTTTTIEKTTQHVKDLSDGDFISFNVNGNSTSAVEVRLTAQDNESTAFTQTFAFSGSSSFKYQANIDLLGLKQEPNADISNAEFYTENISNSATKVSSTPSFGMDSEETISSTLKNYLLGTEASSYSNVNGYVTTENFTLDNEDANDFATEFLSYLDTDNFVSMLLESFTSSSDMVNMDITEIFPLADEEEFKQKTKQFLDNEITAEEYLEYLNSVSAEEIYTEETKQDMLDVLSFIYNCNPSKYLQYTKTTKDKYTTVNSSFDFESWKADVDELHNGIHNDDALSYMSPAHILYRLAPATMTFDFSFVSNPKGVLESLSYNLLLKGTIPSSLLTELLDSNILGALDLEYNISLSGDLSMYLSNKQITISKIEELDSINNSNN